jgi:hypothetical protein
VAAASTTAAESVAGAGSLEDPIVSNSAPTKVGSAVAPAVAAAAGASTAEPEPEPIDPSHPFRAATRQRGS